ncbi:hypothetical protein Tco_0795571 [Tanacetum coccineum]
MASSSNRGGKAKTYEPCTTTEEIALCKAWCEAMENYNAGDMRTGFWSKEHQQLLLDEEALKETLEEEANAKKERAKAEKEWEEFVK